MHKPIINPKFETVLPPLSEDELAALRESIRIDGCRDAIITWRGQIVDGHNRYTICADLGVPFKTVEREFESDAHVRLWMRQNQGGRRNLNEAWRIKLQEDSKADLARIGTKKKAHGKTAPGRTLLPTVDKSVPHSTRKTIASAAGVATSTVGRAEVVIKKRPDLWKEALDGKRTVHQAYTETRKTEQLSEAKKRYADTRQATEIEPVIVRADAVKWLGKQGECDLLLTDPPYMTDVDDINAFAAGWLPLALSKVKPTGRAYVFIGAYPEELHAYLSVAMPTQVLVWTYRNTIGPCAATRYNLNWQAILYYCGKEVPPLTSPVLTERWAVQDINAPDGRQGNRLHKWQKPDELAERIISQSTTPGGVVCDPFCGSGTFVLAAGRLGRRGIGCDKGWQI